MAWFNPPLHKPGNHRCPRCGERRWLWYCGGWALQWRCPKCQSLLKWEKRRSVLAFLLYFPVYCAVFAAVVYGDIHSVTGQVVTAVVAIAIITFIHWWLWSISLVEEKDPVDSSPAPEKPPEAA